MSDDRIPSVEDRINDASRALALGALLARAVSCTDDLMLGPAQESAAFDQLSYVLEEAFAALRCVTNALPGEIHNLPAPEVQ